MKKLLSILLSVFIFNLINAFDVSQKLVKQIEYTNLNKVKSLIKNKIFTKEQKDYLIQVARDSAQLRLQKVSIFKSGRDILRLLFGMGMGSAGSIILFLGLIISGAKESPEGLLVTLISGGSLGILGLYQMIKGWNLSSAYATLNEAHQIEELIRNIPAN